MTRTPWWPRTVVCKTCVRGAKLMARASGMPDGKKRTRVIARARVLHNNCVTAACPCRHYGPQQ